MGIRMERLAKMTPGEIMSTPVKSVANTFKMDTPVLKQQMKDTFELSAHQFKDLTKETIPTKTIANTFSAAGNAFKNFIKSI